MSAGVALHHKKYIFSATFMYCNSKDMLAKFLKICFKGFIIFKTENTKVFPIQYCTSDQI